MVTNQVTYNTTTYLHKSTTNQSFLDMHYYLKSIGIKNNAFFLQILDPDLAGIDPRDPNLNPLMQKKVLRECLLNYWYFIREVVRIPVAGGQVGSGVRYQLHRGNLAMNFGFSLNWCMFVEFPRQNFKSISAVARYLWEFNFGTTNSEFMFLNKSHPDSKLNLQRLKELRSALPAYLRFDEKPSYKGGGMLKKKDTVEVLDHISNGNKIVTKPSAQNRIKADAIGRGCTQPKQWYDEYAFIPFIGIIYQSATPAYKQASQNARRYNKPYGILITTTPGDLTTDSGMDGYMTKEAATPFREQFYDMSPQQLNEVISANTASPFVYIRFTYQQLGRSEDWFKEMVVLMKKDWAMIRREILLEWAETSDNNPFSKEDLNIIETLVKEPIRTVMLRGKYPFDIYENLDPRYCPLVGVDVAAGMMRDSSAITVVDSKTTKVTATLNCNTITTTELAYVLYELITCHMPTAIVNIERNGGFGSSVIGILAKTNVRKNLYYEIKDKVTEEKFNGTTVTKTKVKTRVFGLDNSKDMRMMLMDILQERVAHHKDKFIAPILLKELRGLQVIKGRIDHSTRSHDDQLFSYLMALYIWYNGVNVKENWNMQHYDIKTDEDIEQSLETLEDKYDDTFIQNIATMDNDEVNEQLKALDDGTKSYKEWYEQEKHKDREALMAVLRSSQRAREAYARQNCINVQELEENMRGQQYTIPNSAFKNDFIDDEEDRPLAGVGVIYRDEDDDGPIMW